ncbi:E3 ubiquitin-protein ligase NRDP1 [Halotydeus destructor]|nr:E3 ubiquitin-protein ligase NRDP1 [Halotydeus destructor]
MGYDLDRFTGDIDEELKCPICCGVLEDPVQGSRCEHAYCRKCIAEWMKTSESCPVDRQGLRSSQLNAIPRIVRNLLNHLHIHCDFSVAGCRHIVPLEELGNHRASCPFNPEVPVPCTRGCGAHVPKNLLEGHDCVRDLRDLLCVQQKEINELKATIAQLFTVAEAQKAIAQANNDSLGSLTQRYDHLKLSIQNLESPIRQILLLANRNGDLIATGPGRVKETLAEETTTEIYISNMDRSVTPTILQEYLMRNEVNVISCKEALCRGWKNDYRVTVFKSDCTKILTSGLWPRGIVVFVCGEYYSSKTEGSRDAQDNATSMADTLRACVPPWMMANPM